MTLELREVVSVDIPAPLSKVWSYLRDPALVRRWYGWDHAGLDAQVRAFVDTAIETQDVVGDSAIHTLSWPHHDRLTLRSAAHEPRRTHLAVTRRSHEGMATFDGVRDEADESWVADAHQLQFALTVQPDQDRRTLSMLGLPSGDRRDRLLDRAGLVGIRGVPVGGHVQARRPDGTLLGGTLVYETPLQLGLRLHGISEMFLVLQETPAAHTPPHGTVDAVLSTYGLDDETFEQIRERWTRWWEMALPRSSRVSSA
ncbi:hypothetical protein [Cellulomonas xylanilytica]|uniref:Activator of HSP90 ATPase n=1 Tax=Cellulomonas xylanilytica TaxID=233583 RepID=A0A510VEE8_9CELL|nr:hypothetical protein [Cellulomonas xylanilytica]GEK23560.1 hypothetical protein CXY01_40800 [Cellulomonas xylanilytica]